MHDTLDVLLLLALPASGKSELRRYLAQLDPEIAATDFGLGPTVQLDDYPYVHLMRRVAQELRELDASPVFFASDAEPFLDGRDWATLTALVSEDFAALGSAPGVPDEPTSWLLDRYDRAGSVGGIEPRFAPLPESVRSALSVALDDEVAELARERSATLASYETGISTVVIEFARGGPEGVDPPLPEPHGYQYSLRFLSDDILDRASILYVWVTPEESRNRNEERARPGRDGDASILHHGVPDAVMRGDYGSDDLVYLLESSSDAGTIEVPLGAAHHRIPTAVFDNQEDRTSFLRADPSTWDPEATTALHEALETAFRDLSPPPTT